MDSVVAESHRAIARGSKSFSLAARLFSRSNRDDVSMLYAWCRHCDDVIDGQTDGYLDPLQPTKSLDERLAEIREGTLDALDGKAETFPYTALARVAARHDLPHRYPLDLIEGFAIDARGPDMRSLDDTLRYCYHVAGCVGLMMATIMGVKDRAALDRACDLGIAFQLTNISRDVMADAAIGRVYLPADWLAEVGVGADAVSDRAHRQDIAKVVQRLLAVADNYYASARCGLYALDIRSAWAVATAMHVYRAIG
ncbi:MAG: phytoene/squalene synthase family protein, partial [Pseudomonadota bacterium]